ncbi:unnamed protein product [Adineta ricciae]|uniref:G-protein coupled receptors family 1 profile domain-containing protein n=1 Tax=Adineta ricciae TaxID=249248 RepID=A0A814RZ31_ADIRI|nr:unnamed protein product [Adineta ricciae]CAF1429622.1 unnamed protein product [Adineta ricciae]
MFSNESNHTIDYVQWLPGVQTTACIFYTIILLFGVTGNILVIVIVTRYRNMRSATNLLLTNLSMADLFLLIFCTPEGYQHLYGEDKHRLGKFMCSFGPFVQNVTSTCSVLTIMAISYERYVAICQPLKTSALRFTLFRTLPIVVFIWILSCLVSIPFFWYSKTGTAQSIYGETIVTCFTEFPKSWKNIYLILCTLYLYIFIFLMLCYWHFSICCILFSREALLRDNSIVTRYRRQVAKLLITLILTFFIFIIPYKIWAYVHQRYQFEEIAAIGFHKYSFIAIITRSFLYLNSAINPLLYSVMSTKFRQSLLLLCDDCRYANKDRRSDAVYFNREYTAKQLMGINGGVGGRTTSTTAAKLSYHQFNGSQLHEKKSLIIDNLPTIIVQNPTDDGNLIPSNELL